ncbi:hypothetical protein Ga0074812_10117 [Parafrankia irregularis]|uniref:Uncharacterized protein n=1 Tax=Parafrankia irregularis TaxID=795642 RepID=A0A0S4QEF4_9ACTN|nr:MULTISPECIES: hypothetical protein [Parafrankia]MBE3199808.1 hypothetical protein [Parafrankia sp. CH37]CUU53519.1 hypothetical protein Ga0074812_10117 [Parafrankia irregularis]
MALPTALPIVFAADPAGPDPTEATETILDATDRGKPAVTDAGRAARAAPADVRAFAVLRLRGAVVRVVAVREGVARDVVARVVAVRAGAVRLDVARGAVARVVVDRDVVDREAEPPGAEAAEADRRFASASVAAVFPVGEAVELPVDAVMGWAGLPPTRAAGTVFAPPDVAFAGPEGTPVPVVAPGALAALALVALVPLVLAAEDLAGTGLPADALPDADLAAAGLVAAGLAVDALLSDALADSGLAVDDLLADDLAAAGFTVEVVPAAEVSLGTATASEALVDFEALAGFEVPAGFEVLGGTCSAPLVDPAAPAAFFVSALDVAADPPGAGAAGATAVGAVKVGIGPGRCARPPTTPAPLLDALVSDELVAMGPFPPSCAMKQRARTAHCH